MLLNPIISAQNISIGYSKTKRKDKTILFKDLSFELYRGELVCLLGANGAGKSTLLRSISASQPILKGKIYFENKDIHALSEKELSQNLGLVLTDKTSAGGLLVRELIELGRYPYTGFFGQLDDNDRLIVEKAMQDVGISHKSGSYISELSDGERQKVMIAKALAQECPIVLLDEPTAFLDIESRIDIMNLLHHLTMTQNKAILLSTHDIDMALLLADRLWLLSKENGLVNGVTEDIIVSGRMDNFFRGENIVFDRYTGNFLPKRANNKKVYLKADGLLYHWTKNMLERNGYTITDIENSDILLSVFTKEIVNNELIETHFEIKMKDKPMKSIVGFAELVKVLKDL